ncbi:MAG: Peptide transporter ATP-binding protein [Acidimicrobiales bacterium]|nr:Peptide transporter ATP-binding protein [Acidimicrobiales bacterium]
MSRSPARSQPRQPAPEEGVAARAVGISKIYGSGQTAVRALDDVSIEFPSGHFSAIMGPSGSGKSTLLHCLAGLDRVTSGQVFLADKEISALSEKDLTLVRREMVGFVFQAYNLVPMLDARENIVLPLRLAGREPDQAWLDRIIDTVGLRDRLEHRPDELSGGQQQRVAVARALVTRPAVIFGDEPTGNLDTHASSEVLSFIRAAVDEFGQTVVMVTHDPAGASVADRVVFLVDGRIVDELAKPTPNKILDRMKDLEAVK